MAESVKTPLRMTAREFVTCLAVMAHSCIPGILISFYGQFPLQGIVASLLRRDPM
jgi:hypothetical protein